MCHDVVGGSVWRLEFGHEWWILFKYIVKIYEITKEQKQILKTE